MSEVRWVALLPDPVTGRSGPVTDEAGKPRQWLASDKGAAVELVRLALTRAEFRVCSVVSVLEWETRLVNEQRRRENPWARRASARDRRAS